MSIFHTNWLRGSLESTSLNRHGALRTIRNLDRSVYSIANHLHLISCQSLANTKYTRINMLRSTIWSILLHPLHLGHLGLNWSRRLLLLLHPIMISYLDHLLTNLLFPLRRMLLPLLKISLTARNLRPRILLLRIDSLLCLMRTILISLITCLRLFTICGTNTVNRTRIHTAIDK